MQIIMNTNFIKIGTSIEVVPDGIDYTLSLDKAYKLLFDSWGGRAYLNEVDLPILPSHCYTEKMNKFSKKVLNTFNKTDTATIGVLLSGLKGSGKTLTAKKLAIDSNIPIIIVDDTFPARKLTDFFTKVKQEVCILFDEIDKNPNTWDSSQLLSFLDGIQGTCKKLVIFTCNDPEFINDNMIDRCSRIRYHRKFEGLSQAEIEYIVKDALVYSDKYDDVIKTINGMIVKSYDNILSFVTEVNNNPNEDITELLSDLNIRVD